MKEKGMVATQGNTDDDMQQREHDINSKARFFSCVICIFHILSLSAVCEEEALYLFIRAWKSHPLARVMA